MSTALAERIGLEVDDELEFRYAGTGRRGALLVADIVDAVPGAATGLAVFAPLEAERRAEAVARRLGEAITLGLLPDGSPLPSESDLADRFGVATVTVREALGALREDNLIRTRRGRGGGSFVVTPADGGQQALVARLRRMGLGELRDLADHYTAIAAM